MTRVLKVQGAQSNTGCDKVAEEMMKEEKQGAKRLKVLQFQKLIKQPTN